MLSRAIDSDAELRPLEPWQAEEFATHIAAARPHLEQFLPWVDVTSEVEGAREFLQRYADKLALGEGGLRGIWVDDKLVGGVLFRIWEPTPGMCEIGVWLAPEVTGRGLITKASRVMIDWAFRVREMRRVEWRCVPENTRSSAVARRLGMTLEGTLRETFPYRDRWFDTEVWAVLAEEWARSS